SPPTSPPSVGSPFATATSVDPVDRGATTHSLILDGPRLFRPRTELTPSVLSSVPTFVPTTSPPADDTLLDPPASAPESPLGRSVAPHIRSLAAGPESRVPWGAIAASAIGFAG